MGKADEYVQRYQSWVKERAAKHCWTDRDMMMKNVKIANFIHAGLVEYLHPGFEGKQCRGIGGLVNFILEEWLDSKGLTD